MTLSEDSAKPNTLSDEGAILSENLVRSRQRVADYGEVFTPSWMVEDMLNLVKEETERIDSRFLEPACGSGNFLKSVLTRKLAVVEKKYKKSEFELKHYALFSLMCIYGIELLKDNVDECQANLLEIYSKFLNIKQSNIWSQAGRAVLLTNILEGDALTLTKTDGNPIKFAEWAYLGNGKFQRRDFRYDALTQRSSIDGTLFEMLEEHELFVPTKNYPQMSVEEIAK